MKRLCFGCALILLLEISVSCVWGGITVFSQTHTVSGIEMTGWDSWESFNYTDTAPVSYGWDQIIQSIHQSSGGSAGDFTVSASVLSDYCVISYGTTAISTYQFSSDVGGMTLKLDGAGMVGGDWDEAQAGFYFYDITGGFEIDSSLFTGQIPSWTWDADWDKYYTLDTSHQYQLQIYADAFSGEGGEYNSILNAAIYPIPAPSAILLGGIGVGCVTWLRKRRFL